MATLKAIHQIRGVTVVKRRHKGANLMPDTAYSGDVFETDENTARSLVEAGNAVVPGENPATLDQSSRIASVYETIEDEDEDDHVDTLDTIAQRPRTDVETVKEQIPLTPAQKAAATKKAKADAEKKAAKPSADSDIDPLAGADDDFLADNDQEEVIK